MRHAPESLLRLRQALVSGLIAFALYFGNFPGPFDQIVWTTQSRLASFEASGDFVFVGSSHELTDPTYPKQRQILAKALERLDEAGVRAVYVDAVFSRQSSATADAQLHSAMQGFGPNLYLVENYETGVDGNEHLSRSIPQIGRGIRHVGQNNYTSYLGYIWDAPYSLLRYDDPQPSLPVSMAGYASTSQETFPINYSFRLASIPSLSLEDLGSATGEASPSRLAGPLRGKTVIIGNDALPSTETVDIPGQPGLPSSILQIYAAETLKGGYTGRITALTCLLGSFVILLCCIALRQPGARRAAYGLLGLSLPALVIVSAQLGMRASTGAAFAMLLIYGFLRAKENWRNRFTLLDRDTGLPTFAALEQGKGSSDGALPALIVGKIHRLEDVKRTLPPGAHPEYIQKIVDRLSFSSEELKVHIGHGHFLAWSLSEGDPQIVREHLEGLRSLLSAPLSLGPQLVDVRMTFGVDMNTSLDLTKRLAAAVAAAERSTESYNPIIITESADEEDLLWNISLQSRIDSALANGEITLVYQPKTLISTGDIVGVEALVRWTDPVRGPIPPDVFIKQCESSGRMRQLTRHVLREACNAGNSFEDKNLLIPIAVNISATLLHDREIVRELSDILAETSYNPALLTVEITETYRIFDLDIARDVLNEIKSLGVKVSMDDFGVGAASFEALLNLPFDELKIDRLFVSKILTDAKARGIVRSMLQLGKDLRMIVVAEGVEDPATLACLSKLGCIVAQGFCISSPMARSDVPAFARAAQAVEAS